jgi:nitrate reductase gamma subunit
MSSVFGVVIPYVAALVFLIGIILRVLGWAKSDVPFNITTTAGQQKTLPWIKHNKLENPASTLQVIGRMALEILVFRSLFRNTKSGIHEDRLIHNSNKWLWTFGMIFHWSFLLVFVRHMRFFTGDDLPALLWTLETFDGIFQVGVPTLYLTDLLLVAGASLLFLRRILTPQIRYISFAADYFPLFLILAIALTGIAMRYLLRVDIISVKTLTMGLVTLSPVVPEGIQPIFYIHLFLVSALFAYFPFSKLVHAGGIWLSPTRNMTANTREVRHGGNIPWLADVKPHAYADYENDFRKAMKGAGIPVEKEED